MNFHIFFGKIKQILMFIPFKRKIFCISFQRTGTTSTGDFFKDHGYKVANSSVSRHYHWTFDWLKGDYDKIFKSIHFIKYQVFEDDPWWCNDFYKVLFHRFPNSRFILLERDPNKWFDSMVSHSNGKTLGNTFIHASLYNRLDEYHLIKNSNLIIKGETDNLMDLTEKHREHYIKIYTSRNNEVKRFFKEHAPKRLFNAKLEDNFVWKKMGVFFNIHVTNNYKSHTNASRR